MPTIRDFLLPSGQPKTNITDLLDGDIVKKLGQKVVQETERDLSTMTEWLDKTRKAMDIAKQIVETKTFPWDGAANVKYPLITGASIQFAARAYAEIIKGNDVVKGKVVGADPDGQKEQRAQRISRHMSYQLLEQMTEWEPQTDQMLHILPVVGTNFKKSYFDPLLGRNVSDRLTPGPEGIIFDNKNTKDIDTTRRATHAFTLYGNDIKERISAKIYADVDITKLIPADSDGDDQPPHTIYEQHRWEDFDGDGYQEPYIVTVHKDTETVLRVTARYDAESVTTNGKDEVERIKPATYFTKFGFFPDPEGGYLDLGLGHILYPINESINTTLNQLLDAGTLANVQGGFVARGFRIKAQTFSLGLGEWKQLDVPPGELKNSLLPLPTKGPSDVLFRLLGFLVEAGKALANQTEVLQGEGQPNQPATTTLALIEQGLKVYNSIYKRFYRSMKAELKKLARLNKIYLNEIEYFNVLDEQTAIVRSDYDDKNVDVIPVADPSASTEVQRMARAQALMQITGNPWADVKYILTEYVDAIGADPNKAILSTPPQPPPDPKLLEIEENKSFNTVKLQLEELTAMSNIALNKSKEVLNIAQAEAAEAGTQIDLYMAKVDQINNSVMQLIEMARVQQEGVANGDEGGISGVENPSSDTGVYGVSSGTENESGPAADSSGDGGSDPQGDSVQSGTD